MSTPIAALALLAALAAPLRAVPATYELLLDSSAAEIQTVSLNGTVLVRDRPLSEVRYRGERVPGLPVPLRDPTRGANVVEIVYRSGPGIDARLARREGERTTTIASVKLPGTTGSAAAVERLRFEAPDAPATPATITVADRDAILGVLRRYHGALAARDRSAVLAQYGPWDPERLRSLGASLDGLFAAPGFAMEPLDVVGLEWLVSVQGVEVRRKDGGPVARSGELPAPSPGARGTVRLAPPRLFFRRDGASWKLAFSL